LTGIGDSFGDEPTRHSIRIKPDESGPLLAALGLVGPSPAPIAAQAPRDNRSPPDRSPLRRSNVPLAAWRAGRRPTRAMRERYDESSRPQRITSSAGSSTDDVQSQCLRVPGIDDQFTQPRAPLPQIYSSLSRRTLKAGQTSVRRLTAWTAVGNASQPARDVSPRKLTAPVIYECMSVPVYRRDTTGRRRSFSAPQDHFGTGMRHAPA